jgi:hypothetical protein
MIVAMQTTAPERWKQLEKHALLASYRVSFFFKHDIKCPWPMADVEKVRPLICRRKA